MEGRLLCANREALEMLRSLGEAVKWGNVPEEICKLCNQLRNVPRHSGTRSGDDPDDASLEGRTDLPSSLRVFSLGNSGGNQNPTHLMVLIEHIQKRHEVDPERAKREFGLSRRELEVLRLVCKGMKNREIAEQICICEYTVKDHIKKIMKKMKVGSRSEIVALLR